MPDLAWRPSTAAQFPLNPLVDSPRFMARISLFRRRPPGPAPEAPPTEEGAAPAAPEQAPAEATPALPPPAADPRPPRRPPYHPGVLRRERRALVRAREERIRDIGGLILEMFRRDRFREDLMREQAEEVFGMESRIQEIDSVLVTTRQQIQTARCECGAPLVFGSRFCANCGRPTGEAVVSCQNCRHPLPADARFCGKCGATAPSPTEREPQQGAPADSAPPPSGAEQPAAESGESWASQPSSETPRDPWEQ